MLTWEIKPYELELLSGPVALKRSGASERSCASKIAAH
jgi:hypothetical protein